MFVAYFKGNSNIKSQTCLQKNFDLFFLEVLDCFLLRCDVQKKWIGFWFTNLRILAGREAGREGGREREREGGR
jgi:hypothetical protein